MNLYKISFSNIDYINESFICLSEDLARKAALEIAKLYLKKMIDDERIAKYNYKDKFVPVKHNLSSGQNNSHGIERKAIDDYIYTLSFSGSTDNICSYSFDYKNYYNDEGDYSDSNFLVDIEKLTAAKDVKYIMDNINLNNIINEI